MTYSDEGLQRIELDTRRQSMDGTREDLVEQLATTFSTLLELYRESERANAEQYLSNQRLEAGMACGEVPFCPKCGSSQLVCARCSHRLR